MARPRKVKKTELPPLNIPGIDEEGLKMLQEWNEGERIRLENDAKIAFYKSQNKIDYFAEPVKLSDGRIVESPFPHQKQIIELIRKNKKTVLLQGANQIGKTILGSNLAGAFSAEGCIPPWDKQPLFPSEYAKMNNGKGIIGRILCNDWEKAARDTIVPKLKEWLKVGTYETKKNNVGVEHEFYFPKTRSKFTILTYKEDTKSHEGWTGDWVWADEPPPKDKYTANRRGLVARNGLFFISMTALDEPWILDDIVLKPDHSCGIVADIPIQANPTLSAEAIRIFEKDLPEEEKVARIKGGWLQLEGRIWKCFDNNIHIIKSFKIPPDWPVQFQIDFHLNLPHAISFCACDKYNRFFVCEEVWQNCGSEELANEIIRLKQQNQWRLNYGEIDALSKGDTSYTKNRYGNTESSFDIIEKKLRKYGIRLAVGSKDEKSYVKAVETRLKGPNSEPLLKIFDTCKETIKQVQRWSYDDWGKPKSDGHFPECIGRFTQTGLHYTDPAIYNKPLKYAQMGI